MNQSTELRAATVNGAQAVVEMLRAHGVEIVFGLCGDTSLPLYDALRGSRLQHILTRDERHAAYMADGYARVTGKVGVCEGPSGGGATYILPGLAEANESSIPVLAINTDISVSSRNRFTLTELDQRTLMRPVTKWNAVIDRAADIPRVFRQAFEAMTTGRPGAAHIALPYDVQTAPVEAADVWADPTLGACPSRRVAPDPEMVTLAAKLLRTARNPLFICGGGVAISHAESELCELAEKLGAPVATSVSGKGAIDERCAHAVGVVGSNGGTPETRAIVDAADVIVFVGCRAGSVTTERWRHPAPDQARIIHIDVDPAVPGRNYKVDVPLIADAKLALAALLEAVNAREGDLSAVDARKRAKFERYEALGRSDETPIRPERVVAELSRQLGADATLVADLLLRLLRGPRQRAALLFQSCARRARLLIGRCRRRPFRAARCKNRRGDGRRQLRHVRGRARDAHAAEAPDHGGGAFQRHLRLDQGGPARELRAALLLRRFQRYRPCRRGARLWAEELARD